MFPQVTFHLVIHRSTRFCLYQYILKYCIFIALQYSSVWMYYYLLNQSHYDRYGMVSSFCYYKQCAVNLFVVVCMHRIYIYVCMYI